MKLSVEVTRIINRDESEPVKGFDVEAPTYTKAKALVAAALREKWDVRSVNIHGSRTKLIAYVTDKRKIVSGIERKKPVRHTGLVGKGRSLVDASRSRKGRK